MITHSQKSMENRLEVGPEREDGTTVCEVLLDDGSDDNLKELQSAFDQFSRGAECGVFRSESKCAPRFRVAEHEVDSDRNRVTWRFEGSHVDYAAYRVLINLLRQMSSGLPDGLSVRINAGRSGGRDAGDWSALSTHAITRVSDLPFNLEDDVLDPPGKQLVVMIYSLGDISEELMARVSDALSAWTDVVMAGGFSNEFGDGSEEIEVPTLIEHHQIGPRTIECSIYRLANRFGVIDALVNTLVFIHETVVEIESVEMD